MKPRRAALGARGEGGPSPASCFGVPFPAGGWGVSATGVSPSLPPLSPPPSHQGKLFLPGCKMALSPPPGCAYATHTGTCTVVVMVVVAEQPGPARLSVRWWQDKGGRAGV